MSGTPEFAVIASGGTSGAICFAGLSKVATPPKPEIGGHVREVALGHCGSIKLYLFFTFSLPKKRLS
jgi:hypothetical protein